MSKTYICSVCKKYKTASEFPKCSRNKYRNCLNCTCKKCFKDIYGKNRRQVKESEALDKLLKIRLHDAQVRAKKKNLYIDITLEYLKQLWNKQEGKCALTNFPMSYQQSNGKRNPYSLSIDKIDPNKGYEVGNVQFVCFAANMMKGELSLSELKKFCQAIIKNNNYA